ncbi:MAG: hypothetical protein GEU73_04970 [Chloroflexi bacterium]|nr:hypothetical protein [Chloroflexota bacterium]
MLPSLASLEQFEARIAGGVSSADEDRAQAALDDASSLIRQEAGLTWATEDDLSVGLYDLDADLPDVIVTITIAVAKRAYLVSDEVQGETLGDYQWRAPSSSGLYLTKAEKKLIRQVAGKTGLWTQATTRMETTLDVPTVYIDVEPEGEPIPWDVKEPS